MEFPFRGTKLERPNLNVVTLRGFIAGVISGPVCGRCGREEALTATVEAGLMKGKRTLLRHCLLKLNENSDFSRNLSPSRVGHVLNQDTPARRHIVLNQDNVSGVFLRFVGLFSHPFQGAPT